MTTTEGAGSAETGQVIYKDDQFEVTEVLRDGMMAGQEYFIEHLSERNSERRIATRLFFDGGDIPSLLMNVSENVLLSILRNRVEARIAQEGNPMLNKALKHLASAQLALTEMAIEKCGQPEQLNLLAPAETLAKHSDYVGWIRPIDIVG